MVSWIRWIAFRWDHFEPGFGAAEAVALQEALVTVRGRLEPAKYLLSLIEEIKEKPGVFLISRGETSVVAGVEKIKPTFRVAPFHHLRIEKEEVNGEEIALFYGLASMSPTGPMGEVKVAELVEGLVS